jgi:hypothetical protein
VNAGGVVEIGGVGGRWWEMVGDGDGSWESWVSRETRREKEMGIWGITKRD